VVYCSIENLKNMKRISLIPDQAIPTSIPVAIYARVPNKKQVGRFKSCDAHVEGCQKYILDRADEGWVLSSTFVDPVDSGKDMERPCIRKLMNAIAAGEIRALVVYRLDGFHAR
jgi:site-specific DNA recombinase